MLYYYQRGLQGNARQHKPLTANLFLLLSCSVSVHYQRILSNVRVSLPGGCTHSPVLKFLAVDAHSSLVALGDTHLVSAALNLLAGVLGGVYIWGKKWKNESPTAVCSLHHF